MTKHRDGFDLARQIAAENPTHRFAVGCNGSVIGIWADSVSRYVAIASATITGEWVRMEYEIKINGQIPVYDWKPLAEVAKS